MFDEAYKNAKAFTSKYRRLLEIVAVVLVLVAIVLAIVLPVVLANKKVVAPVVAAENYETPIPKATTTAKPKPAPRPITTPPAENVASLVALSDITISQRDIQDAIKTDENINAMETVDERFDAAQRSPMEHGLSKNMNTQKERRKLIETLTRRPYCGRRNRSWRQAFSDQLRGDPIPKHTSKGTWNMMRVGHSDPFVDLHPGALGTISGNEGRWNAEQAVPANFYDSEPYFMNE